MKICTTCKKRKRTEDFNKSARRKDGLQPHCRECNRQMSRAYYQRNRAKHIAVVVARNARIRREFRQRIWDYLKEHPCVDCGEADPIVLEFDHVKGKKRADVGRMRAKGYSWESVLEEIAKCQVRCSNCHKRRTAKQFGWYASIR